MFKNVCLNFFKVKISPTIQFAKLFRKNFNTTASAATTPATGKEQQISTQPLKTKEQLKVEAQMQQWPEHLRNPKILEMEKLKEYLEFVYKFHQGDKKYLGPFDLPAPVLSQMETRVNWANTTDSIGQFFSNNEGFLPDHFIIRKFHQIALTHGDKSPELFDEILPQVKKLVLNCDRQNPQVLFHAVEAGSLLNLQDKEFWSMIVRIN
jgi:hypothetical protein